jgi:hypothetical protein
VISVTSITAKVYAKFNYLSIVVKTMPGGPASGNFLIRPPVHVIRAGTASVKNKKLLIFGRQLVTLKGIKSQYYELVPGIAVSVAAARRFLCGFSKNSLF